MRQSFRIQDFIKSPCYTVFSHQTLRLLVTADGGHYSRLATSRAAFIGNTGIDRCENEWIMIVNGIASELGSNT